MSYSHIEIKRVDLQNASLEQIVSDLEKLTPLELALLKAKSQDGDTEVLDSPQLSVFWINKFNKIRLQRDTCFQFRDPFPKSRADFYCGYTLYLAARKEKGTSESNYEEYLSLSAFKFDSFHAIQQILTTLIIGCKESTEQKQIDNLYSNVDALYSKLLKFKTPGCLLLANTYFYLAGFYQNLNMENKTIDCYRRCWELIHLAGLFEESSERLIHNAYFGQGLKMSNAYGLSTINEIKENCLQRGLDALPYTVRHVMEMDALKKFSSEMQQEQNLRLQCDDQPYMRAASSSRSV
ncbi:Dot/Icm T4SS effector metaeffector MesI [Legionella bononiensis]|uniref:DUF5630 domain-containing protein n=1 Tax=Legionella bononiensis TaxID=2793102 RepID=A0ABS1WBM3_9GAMM|nr:Dot/Icm T4SS effector metaeffector MesI [Legionella bononiensis]MBL7481049.1 DUF5630 domain-containing protein [Legionella bononiensis]MBL7526758.1 DUF5630 domain-containing protein [Legionella bononiensis]MBL7564165.1 DUF5630 domain-containing protein [Legionella bononiensis]